LLPAVVAGTPKQETAQAAPSESRMGFVIQCPCIPDGMDAVPTCQGRPATCVGTDGDDVIWGTEDDDVILGRLGDDAIQADDGDDIVCAGPGNDALHGATGMTSRSASG
jgi:Ca2+-binding RTX toxin-like protein